MCSDRSECAYLDLLVDPDEAPVSHNSAAVEEALGHAIARDTVNSNRRSAVAGAGIGEERPSASNPKDGLGPRHRSDRVWLCEAVQVDSGPRQVQDQATRSKPHQVLMPSRRASSWAWSRCFDAYKRQPCCHGSGSIHLAMLSSQRSSEVATLSDPVLEDECHNNGRELQCHLWEQGISAMGTSRLLEE